MISRLVSGRQTGIYYHGHSTRPIIRGGSARCMIPSWVPPPDSPAPRPRISGRPAKDEAAKPRSDRPLSPGLVGHQAWGKGLQDTLTYHRKLTTAITQLKWSGLRFGDEAPNQVLVWSPWVTLAGFPSSCSALVSEVRGWFGLILALRVGQMWVGNGLEATCTGRGACNPGYWEAPW